jgi:hypothetical protein
MTRLLGHIISSGAYRSFLIRLITHVQLSDRIYCIHKNPI